MKENFIKNVFYIQFKKEDFLFYAKYSCINSKLLISLYTINLIKISIYFIGNDLKNEFSIKES
ncbi:MAG: hypothetical protein CM15mP45_22930 [Deltaproteobacteria bacterium]|nr:MAG: hypothetical protein CM15mP45_22930 [Deltaproteobacteria bacterium]